MVQTAINHHVIVSDVYLFLSNCIDYFLGLQRLSLLGKLYGLMDGLLIAIRGILGFHAFCSD